MLPKPKAKMWITMTALIALLGANALASGCIVYEDDHHHYDPNPNPHDTPPPYEPYWVEVGCWAVAASSSSESLPGSVDFSAIQATDLPDTQDWNAPQCVDSPYAWSPEFENAGAEWIDLLIDPELRVDRVRIYESFGAGASDTVTLANSLSESVEPIGYAVPWDLQGDGQPCSVLNLDLDDPYDGNEYTFDTFDTVMIDLDTTLTLGWNEIDAVQVIGLFDDNSGPLPSSCEYF